MRVVFRTIRIGILGMSLACAADAIVLSPVSRGAPDIEGRIDALLEQMTIEEKAGQLAQFSSGILTGPGTDHGDYKKRIERGEIGSLFNVSGAAQTNAIQKIAVEQSRLHIPLLFGFDVIHGYRTIFPVPLGLASTWDTALIEQSAQVAAREATAEGIRWTFSPMVDVARDARWGRIVEGAGEDPYLGSAIAQAYVRGYQGPRLADPTSMAACAKHFVAYGAAEAGRDYNTVDISELTLRTVYLPPFHAAVEAGAASIMSAFNVLNGVPASANTMTLTSILRHEWNFDGLVVSDFNAVGELVEHGVALDGTVAAAKAFRAGVDMDMQSGLYASKLSDLVRSGAVSSRALDDAVRRVLRLKFQLGLFDRPYVGESKPANAIPQEHLELARRAAEESFVLLKNDASVGGENLLPIGGGVRTIALIGPLGDSAHDMLGSWAARGNASDVVSLRTALSSRLQKSRGTLLYAKGTEVEGTSDAGFAEARAAALKSDLVVMALGERADTMTGEAASRSRLDLPGNQQQLLESLVRTGKPVVLIVFSGRPLVLTWAAEHVPAIIEAWMPGVQAGPALDRVLFGQANFSAKLPVSFPRAVGQEPLYYNVLNTGRPIDSAKTAHSPATRDEKYKSRYVDERNDALFPFGYGLSYSQFRYGSVALSASRLSAKQLNSGNASLHVSAEVKNDGTREADEVVQLYLQVRGTSVARPVRELKGFKRIHLVPGESRPVEFVVGPEELKIWNADMHYIVEPANVKVWIAPSSVAGSEASFSITE